MGDVNTIAVVRVPDTKPHARVRAFIKRQLDLPGWTVLQAH